jgi:hypothetical protein
MAKRAVMKVSPTTKPLNWRSLFRSGAAVAATLLANAPALASAAQSSRASPVRPTTLGLELLQRMPPYVAMLCEIHDLRRTLQGDAKEAAHSEAFERINEIAQAIVVRPTTDMAHLVDLAIVARWDYDSNYPSSHGAECLMVKYFLKLGGVAEADCDMEAIERRLKAGAAHEGVKLLGSTL